MSKNTFENKLNEFKEDLKKQCVILMGLPAAGKSTFINQELHKVLPSVKDYKVINSDSQVKRLQYLTAKSDYNWLIKNVKNSEDIKKFKVERIFTDNSGEVRSLPITLEWWEQNKDKGIKNYFKTFYKVYYAVYFDIRDLAKKIDKKLWKTKVFKSGDILIIDTVASKPNKIIKRLKDTKKQGYNNTIIYLDIDPQLCVIRDKYRKETEGRGVGEEVIFGYAKKMDDAYKSYQNEGKKSDGVLDKLLMFHWVPKGNSPIKGTWEYIKEKSINYSLEKRKKKIRDKWQNKINKESIENFIINNDIKKIIKEVTSGSSSSTDADDGPSTWHTSNNDYKSNVKELAQLCGFTIIDYLISGKYDVNVKDEHPPKIGVTYFPAGDADKTTVVNYKDLKGKAATKAWLKDINNVILQLGFKFLNFNKNDSLGLKDAEKLSRNTEKKESFSKKWWKDTLQLNESDFSSSSQ